MQRSKEFQEKDALSEHEQQRIASNAEDVSEVVSGRETELPPVDGGWRAWTFCFAAFWLETMVWGFGYSYGVFQEYYSTHEFQSASNVAISAVGTVSLALTFGSTIPLMLYFRRYPTLIKPTMWVGLVVAVAALVVSSFANAIWQLIILQGVIYGLAGGMIYIPIVFWLPQWFVKHRGLAGGLVMGGSGIGGFVFPLILNALLSRLGFRWTLRIWALIMAVVAGPAVLAVNPRVPLPKHEKGSPRPSVVPKELPFFRDAAFWMFSCVNMLQALSYFPVSLYLTVFTTSVASSLSATAVLSVFNVACIFGQVAIGYLCDRLPYPWIACASAFGSALVAFLLWGFSYNLGQVFGFAVLFGGLSGGFASVWQPAATDCAGKKGELQPYIFGLFATIKGVAAVIGPIISGILYDAGKGTGALSGKYGRFGFGKMEIFVGSLAMATSVVSIILGVVRVKFKRPVY
ncbi:MFS general substrate transporter [Gloeophyllum trabeum ATCC 11539]|uniref:MFS general substrate transporter n=1 Tax=Gloeophyllum trabeum (strain ATCC 11539 / FP-39264 / Madison 617) TaxID=670483 RepID=S7RT64_GLOTA|nr:MFS general substrate transporter [Gloeophyllum trabeum ATCC 11539]EPQ56309.1 MFS general substrate transporter [Gloeophyllum trabeum ATCC 11539]